MEAKQRGDAVSAGGANRLPSLSSLPFSPRSSGMSISSLLGSSEPGSYDDLASRHMSMSSAGNVAAASGTMGQPSMIGRVNLPPPLSFDPAMDRRRQNLEPNHARAEDALPRPKVRSGSSSPNHISSQDANGKKERKRHHHHHHHHVGPHQYPHHHNTHHHHHHRAKEGVAGRAPRTLDEMTPLPDHKPELIVHSGRAFDALQDMKSVHLGSHVYEGQLVSLPRLAGRENALISIRIPERFVEQSDAMDKRRIWGTDIYTDDSDPVCILKHIGKRPERPRQDVIITFRVLPPLVEYKGSLRHQMKTRTWNVQHDGMSIMVENVDFVTVGIAEERGGEMAKKRIRDYIELSGRGLHPQWKPTLEKRSKLAVPSTAQEQNKVEKSSGSEGEHKQNSNGSKSPPKRPSKSSNAVETIKQTDDKEAEETRAIDTALTEAHDGAKAETNDKAKFRTIDKGDAHDMSMHDAPPASSDDVTKMAP